MKYAYALAGVVAGFAAATAMANQREANVRDVEYGRGFDDGHLAGWVEGRDHHHQERTAAVGRAADARVDHPSTRALFDQLG